jgi:splicing factor 1
MPPADAAVAGASEMHDAAGSNDGASAPSDPSTALVCIEGGSENGTSIATGGGGGRRTRFSTSSFDAALLLSIHDSHLPPNFPLHVACKGMTTGQADAVLSHLRLEAIEAQLKLLAAGRPLDEVDPLPVDPLTLEPTRARSPSPEPIYDPATGVRVNTRRERLRVRLLTLQKRIVSEALLRSPNDFRPPAGFRRSAAGRVRFEAKLLIPLDEYPDYNFKGVIIGARGANQQELERRTGCKIAVRGKGSQSDNKPESMRRHYEGEDEPQHCWIQADTEEALARGVAEVKKLLVPLSDEERRKSLQALFEANGWVREAQACRVCGSTEHLMRACPDRNKGRSFVSAAHVSCRLCGARTHPTLDCPTARAKGWSRAQTLEHLRSQEGAGLMDADERVDADYERFIQELLGGDGEDGDEDGGEGSESKEMLPKRNRVSMSSSSVPTIARGANGMQLALLPPTTREQHEAAQATAAMLKQHESFREYTPHSAAREQQVQAHAQPAAGTFHHPHPQHHPPLHPSLPSPSHYANGGGAASSNGWSTTQLLVPPPPPPPPPPPLHVSHPPSMVLAAALAAAAALPLMPPPPPPPVYAGPTFSAFAPLPTVMSMAPRAQVLCPWEPPPPGL